MIFQENEGSGSTISEGAAVFPEPPFPRQSTTLYREFESHAAGEPRSQPPPTILAGSPVSLLNQQLCSSLDHISLPSEGWDPANFRELISKAHKYLGKALQIVSKHVAAPLSNSSLMSEILRYTIEWNNPHGVVVF